MAGNIVLGPDAKVDIGPLQVPFRVVTGRMRDTADVNETTDTETRFRNKEHHGNGYTMLIIDIDVQFDTEDDNPTVKLYTFPLNLTPDLIIEARIWPEGRNIADSDWHGIFVVREVAPGFAVRGSQPQGGPISLVSAGYYKRPYEVLLVDPSTLIPLSQIPRDHV